MQQKGFTLVELLIVIAILAVLAVALVLVLNPAELLKQSRDTRRISDLGTLNSAISLYLADGQTWSTNSVQCSSQSGTTTMSGGPACTNNTSTAVSGGGWVSIDFAQMSTGAPFAGLPLDPTNDSTYFFVFRRTTTVKYEIDGNMESAKFVSGGGSDVESNSKDAGSNNGIYEVGNDLTL